MAEGIFRELESLNAAQSEMTSEQAIIKIQAKLKALCEACEVQNEIQMDFERLSYICVSYVQMLIGNFIAADRVDPKFYENLGVIQEILDVKRISRPFMEYFAVQIMEPIQYQIIEYPASYELVKYLNKSLGGVEGFTVENNFTLCKLMDYLCICGDFDYQLSLLEFIISVRPEVDEGLARLMFPDSDKLQDMLRGLNLENFTVNTRPLLNEINVMNSTVHSVSAQFVYVGDLKLQSPLGKKCPLWIDFNQKSYSISIYCQPFCQNDRTNVEMLFINKGIVTNIKIKRSLKNKTEHLVILNIHLKDHIKVSLKSSKKIAQERFVKLYFIKSAEIDNVIENYLPNIFPLIFKENQSRRLKDGVNYEPLSIIHCRGTRSNIQSTKSFTPTGQVLAGNSNNKSSDSFKTAMTSPERQTLVGKLDTMDKLSITNNLCSIESRNLSDLPEVQSDRRISALERVNIEADRALQASREALAQTQAIESVQQEQKDLPDVQRANQPRVARRKVTKRTPLEVISEDEETRNNETSRNKPTITEGSKIENSGTSKVKDSRTVLEAIPLEKLTGRKLKGSKTILEAIPLENSRITIIEGSDNIFEKNEIEILTSKYDNSENKENIDENRLENTRKQAFKAQAPSQTLESHSRSSIDVGKLRQDPEDSNFEAENPKKPTDDAQSNTKDNKIKILAIHRIFKGSANKKSANKIIFEQTPVQVSTNSSTQYFSAEMDPDEMGVNKDQTSINTNKNDKSEDDESSGFVKLSGQMAETFYETPQMPEGNLYVCISPDLEETLANMEDFKLLIGKDDVQSVNLETRSSITDDLPEISIPDCQVVLEGMDLNKGKGKKEAARSKKKLVADALLTLAHKAKDKPKKTLPVLQSKEGGRKKRITLEVEAPQDSGRPKRSVRKQKEEKQVEKNDKPKLASNLKEAQEKEAPMIVDEVPDIISASSLKVVDAKMDLAELDLQKEVLVKAGEPLVTSQSSLEVVTGAKTLKLPQQVPLITSPTALKVVTGATSPKLAQSGPFITSPSSLEVVIGVKTPKVAQIAKQLKKRGPKGKAKKEKLPAKPKVSKEELTKSILSFLPDEPSDSRISTMEEEKLFVRDDPLPGSQKSSTLSLHTIIYPLSNEINLDNKEDLECNEASNQHHEASNQNSEFIKRYNKTFEDNEAINQLLEDNEATNQLAEDNEASNQLAEDNEATNQLAEDNKPANQVAINNEATNQVAINNEATNQVAEYNEASNRVVEDNEATNQLAAYNEASNQVVEDNEATNQVAIDNEATSQLSEYNKAINQVVEDNEVTNQLAADNEASNQVVEDNEATNQLAGDNEASNQVVEDNEANKHNKTAASLSSSALFDFEESNAEIITSPIRNPPSELETHKYTPKPIKKSIPEDLRSIKSCSSSVSEMCIDSYLNFARGNTSHRSDWRQRGRSKMFRKLYNDQDLSHLESSKTLLKECSDDGRSFSRPVSRFDEMSVISNFSTSTQINKLDKSKAVITRKELNKQKVCDEVCETKQNVDETEVEETEDHTRTQTHNLDNSKAAMKRIELNKREEKKVGDVTKQSAEQKNVGDALKANIDSNSATGRRPNKKAAVKTKAFKDFLEDKPTAEVNIKNATVNDEAIEGINSQLIHAKHSNEGAINLKENNQEKPQEQPQEEGLFKKTSQKHQENIKQKVEDTKNKVAKMKSVAPLSIGDYLNEEGTKCSKQPKKKNDKTKPRTARKKKSFAAHENIASYLDEELQWGNEVEERQPKTTVVSEDEVNIKDATVNDEAIEGINSQLIHAKHANEEVINSKQNNQEKPHSKQEEPQEEGLFKKTSQKHQENIKQKVEDTKNKAAKKKSVAPLSIGDYLNEEGTKSSKQPKKKNDKTKPRTARKKKSVAAHENIASYLDEELQWGNEVEERKPKTAVASEDEDSDLNLKELKVRVEAKKAREGTPFKEEQREDYAKKRKSEHLREPEINDLFDNLPSSTPNLNRNHRITENQREIPDITSIRKEDQTNKRRSEEMSDARKRPRNERGHGPRKDHEIDIDEYFSNMLDLQLSKSRSRRRPIFKKKHRTPSKLYPRERQRRGGPVNILQDVTITNGSSNINHTALEERLVKMRNELDNLIALVRRSNN